MSTITSVVLSVPDISCGHCEQAIRTELGELDGVSLVVPSAVTKQVTLSYDPNVVALDEIRERLRAIEYPVAD